MNNRLVTIVKTRQVTVIRTLANGDEYLVRPDGGSDYLSKKLGWTGGYWDKPQRFPSGQDSHNWS